LSLNLTTLLIFTLKFQKVWNTFLL
jgi:hypothetical protein